MCGRYTLSAPGDVVAESFGLAQAPVLVPRFNIAPSQEVPIVRAAPTGPRHELALVRWGLVPSWAREAAIGNRLINARAETVTEKPAFRDSFRRRRCLVVADGFYEWQTGGRRKQPWHFRRPDGTPIALAGLWARWPDPAGGDLETCAILTTEANEVVAPVHGRMPVLLDRAGAEVWLHGGAESARLASLLAPAPSGALVGYPVSPAVNDPRHDAPDCVLPLPSREPGSASL
ncbi:MAG TPA: SOS response-associated peptidase [Thermoanaerobaculia bacterium]|nr:SOS response-associated peptidase [Thermoanaerobaculia bacterium]